ncbi:MAG: EAL domain-containing protein [Steroidobacteraceae bacterium]
MTAAVSRTATGSHFSLTSPDILVLGHGIGKVESRISVLLHPQKVRLRWGIGARLGVAFVSVAALAVAANLLAEHAMSIIHTTRVVRVVALPRSPVPALVAPVLSAPTPAPAMNEVATPEALIAAIELYEGAVRARVAVQNDTGNAQVAAALKDLERATQNYVSQFNGAVASARLEPMRAGLTAYQAHAEELLRVASSREQLTVAFQECFDELDARTKAALARSWRIFGHVIARNSLVDFNASLDTIRRDYATRMASGDPEQASLEAVSASAAALIAAERSNDAALVRSLGEPWVAQLRSDVARISLMQQALVPLTAQRRQALDDFAHESLSVIALAGATKPLVVTRNRVAAPVLGQGTSASGAALDGRVAAPLLSLMPVATEAAVSEEPGDGPDVGRNAEDTSVVSAPSEYTNLMFWLSAGVLLALLILSVLTVISVVGPVRRMRQATRRLAAGESRVQVARGGVRELDDLAVSFNQMAEQLAVAQEVARNYQDQLELKVNLRTRELQHLAEHDALTDLPNRRQLFSRLKTAITQAAEGSTHVGVFFIDLDNFKNINDSMGHVFGDRVLGAVAERLRAATGANGFAARLGGDEFTVIYTSAASEAAVRLAGWDLVRAFQKPLRVDGRDLMISISVGVSLYPQHGSDTDALLRAADAALFRAKALGRSQLTEFSPELLEAASTKFSTEQGLRQALERGEFELVFQPEVSSSNFTTGLVEALLRWRLPDGRRASPAEFLAVAEESGLIMEISDWVLDSAIAAASRWHHGAWPDARVAINLSSRQLLDGRFVEHVMRLLHRHKIPAHCIEIELTENVLQTGKATIEVLHQLRAQGIAIALDDFGTGYSSLASLEQLPLTRVKLDRALIASIHTSTRSAAIARAIVGLCHNLGLEVTAEGIEYREQLLMLSDMAPISLQGYLIARPVSADQVPATLASLPNRLESILLTSSAGPTAALDASSADYTVRNLRRL